MTNYEDYANRSLILEYIDNCGGKITWSELLRFRQESRISKFNLHVNALVNGGRLLKDDVEEDGLVKSIYTLKHK